MLVAVVLLLLLLALVMLLLLGGGCGGERPAPLSPGAASGQPLKGDAPAARREHQIVRFRAVASESRPALLWPPTACSWGGLSRPHGLTWKILPVMVAL